METTAAAPTPEPIQKKRFTRWDAFALALFLFTLCEGLFFFAQTHALKVALLAVLTQLFILALWAAKRFWHAGDSEFVVTRIFPVVLFVLACTNLVIFQPGTVPDELYHYRDTYSVANLISPGVDALEARDEDVAFFTDSDLFFHIMSNQRWEGMKQKVTLTATHTGWRSVEGYFEADIPSPPFYLRLPGALGINLARLCNLSGFATFYVGRFCNMLLGVALIALAVRLAPIGKNIMMTVALLPMTVHLLGSYSYDAGIIGLAFLSAALLLRLIRGSGKLAPADILTPVLTLVLLSPYKMIYAAPIGLLIFCVPKERFANARQMWLCRCACVLAPLLMIAVVKLPTLLAPLIHPAEVTAKKGPVSGERTLTGGQHYHTIPELLAYPTRTFWLYVRTFNSSTGELLFMLLGRSLGWFQGNIVSQLFLMFPLFGCLGIATVTSQDDCGHMAARERVLMAVIFCIVCLACATGMLVSYTLSTELVIQGIQGRYFLPVLPLLLLAARPTSMKTTCKVAMPLLLCTGAFVLLNLNFIVTSVTLG